MKNYVKKSKRVSRKTTFKRRVNRKAPRKTSIKRMIKTEIARAAENKTQQTFKQSQLLTYGSALFSTNNNILCSMGTGAISISQGTGQGDRIGNKIRLKKLMFKGTISPVNVDDSGFVTAPVNIKMVFYSVKPSPPLPANLLATSILQLGSTTSALTGTVTDLWAPWNADDYTVHTVRHCKLGFAANYTAFTSAFGGFANNDFKMNYNFSINIAKYMPQTVLYNDNGATPTSRQVYCAVIVTPVLPGTFATELFAAEMQYILDAQYEDS